MMCLESAGRLPLVDYRRATMYTTLSPCAMCAGAILHYQIPRCVIADSEHFQGEEARPSRAANRTRAPNRKRGLMRRPPRRRCCS